MTKPDDAARRKAASSLRISAKSWKIHDPCGDVRFENLCYDLGTAIGCKPCADMPCHEFLSRLADYIDPGVTDAEE